MFVMMYFICICMYIYGYQQRDICDVVFDMHVCVYIYGYQQGRVRRREEQ